MASLIELQPITASTGSGSDIDIDNLYNHIVSLPRDPRSKRIRILEVEPRQPTCSFESEIVAQLYVVDLAATPKPHLNALSYVWGIDKERHTITCNGIHVAVTYNALSALRHLRDKLGKFSIWIDAICINHSKNND